MEFLDPDAFFLLGNNGDHLALPVYLLTDPSSAELQSELHQLHAAQLRRSQIGVRKLD